MTAKIPYSTRLPQELIARAQIEAERQDRSIAWIIKTALRHYFDRLDAERRGGRP